VFIAENEDTAPRRKTLDELIQFAQERAARGREAAEKKAKETPRQLFLCVSSHRLATGGLGWLGPWTHCASGVCMGAVQLALPDARSRRTWGSTNAQWHTHTQHSLMVVDFSADNNYPLHITCFASKRSWP
jgi:hypothetical protein